MDRLHQLGGDIAAQIGNQNVLVVPTDVSNLEQVQRLKDKAYETFGEVRTTRFLVVFVVFWFLAQFRLVRRNRSTTKRARAHVGGCPVQQCGEWREGDCARRLGQLEEGD